jgi:hypothetical protein
VSGPVPEGKRVAYSSWAVNWILAVSGASIGLVMVLLAIFLSGHPLGLLISGIIVIIVSVQFSSLRVTAGGNGVIARYGPFGQPRFRFSRDSISEAAARDVTICDVGGLGLHWSPWRGTRLTVRTGPTLQLSMVNGCTVLISVADPDHAVRAITGR